MLFKLILLIALLSSCILAADLVACDTAQAAGTPSDQEITIKLGTTKLANAGAPTVDSVANINTCFAALIVPADGVVTKIIIDLNSTDLTGDSTPLDFTQLPASAVIDSTYDVSILDSGTLVPLNTAKTFQLFLDGVIASISEISLVDINVTAALDTDRATSAQVTSIKAITEASKITTASKIDGVAQSITDTASLTTAFTTTDITKCTPANFIINVSTAVTEAQLATCLAAVSAADSLLHTLTYSAASQSLTAATDLSAVAYLGSTVAGQLTSLTIDYTGNTISALPTLTAFSSLETLSIDLTNNSINMTDMGTFLTAAAVDSAYPASITSVTLTLLSATVTAAQNYLVNYDLVKPVLASSSTTRLMTVGLITDAQTPAACTADNGIGGTANSSWASSAGTVCTMAASQEIETNATDSADPHTIMQCTGDNLELTVGDVLNGDGTTVTGTTTYTWTWPNASGATTQISDSLKTQTAATSADIVLAISTLDQDQTYTATVTTDTTPAIATTYTFQPIACLPSTNIVVSGGDSDSAVEVCEEITIQLDSIANDADTPTVISDLVLDWTFATDISPALSGQKDTIVIPKDSLTAATEYTVSVAIGTNANNLVINNASTFKFTPVACNDKAPAPAADDSSSLLRFSLLLVVIFAYIL